MKVQICSQCSWPMEDSHYTICWTCWRENQGYKRIKSDDRYDSLQKIIHQLLEESSQATNNHVGWSKHYQGQIHQLKMQISQLKYELENKKPLDQKLIKQLLMFCHPDKNQDRQDEAGELTKTLLSLRDKKK